MTIGPPDVGEDGWGEELNAYLASLEERIVELELKPEIVFSSYSWKFSASAPPAAAGELRLNNANPTLATSIDVRKIDVDGADRTPAFQQITVGDTIRVNDWDDATKIHRYHATATPTIGVTNVTIPVAWFSGAGALPTAGTAKINVGFLLSLIV